MKKHTTQKIIINGKEYSSIEEVPNEFRHFLEDKDQDGMPDFVQQFMGSGKSFDGKAVTTHFETTINGTDLQDLPKSVQKTLSSAGVLDNDGQVQVQNARPPHEFKKDPTPSYFPTNPYENEIQKNSFAKKIVLLILVLLLGVGLGIYFS